VPLKITRLCHGVAAGRNANVGHGVFHLCHRAFRRARAIRSAVVDPAQLAVTATMSLAERSLVIAFAADVAAFVVEDPRKQPGVQ